MRSLKAIMDDEHYAWRELCSIDDDLMSYEMHIADINKIPVNCPAKERDIEEYRRMLSDSLNKREAAVENLNRRRDELRKYFNELMNLNVAV